MKTTIDLPPKLVKEMKLRAVNEGRKLKDVASEVFQKGLEATAFSSSAKPQKGLLKFPLFGGIVNSGDSEVSIEEALRLEQDSQEIQDHEQLGISL